MSWSKLTPVSCLVATMLVVSACSKSENPKTAHEITATAPVTGAASTLTERNAEQRFITNLQANLEKAGIKAKIVSAKTTEIPNWYWVTLDGLPSVWATADGKYVVQGDVVRLGDSKPYRVNEALQATENQAKFAALKTSDLIVYPATGGTAKHVVYIFTDASCPYCHKLHGNLKAMNDKGIEVRYIAWPRGDQFFATMQNIWCSADRKAAFDQAVAGQPLPATQCPNPVMDQYKLGMNIGVNGTPAIYSQDGHYLAGYIEPDELLKKLEQR